jgi:hypothetical protein
MLKNKFLPIILLTALLSGVPADGKPRNFRTLQLMALKEMRETVISAQKSDDVMLKEIDLVANQLGRVLNSRVRTRGSQPLYMQEGEIDRLEKQLARNIGSNPYAGNPYLAGKSGEATQPQIETRLSDSNGQSVFNSTSGGASATSNNPNPLVNQPSVLQNMNVFEKKPERPLNTPRVALVLVPESSLYEVASLRKEPPEDWRAEPGTIQIVHNGSDLCFIWGAGIEGRPVYDREKQRFKVISMRMGQH